MKSLCHISTSHRAFVLAIPSVSRPVVLCNTASVTEMPVTSKGPFHSSRHVLFTYHTRQLLLLHKTMNTRYPLVRGNRLEALQSLIILVRYDNG